MDCHSDALAGIPQRYVKLLERLYTFHDGPVNGGSCCVYDSWVVIDWFLNVTATLRRITSMTS